MQRKRFTMRKRFYATMAGGVIENENASDVRRKRKYSQNSGTATLKLEKWLQRIPGATPEIYPEDAPLARTLRRAPTSQAPAAPFPTTLCDPTTHFSKHPPTH